MATWHQRNRPVNHQHATQWVVVIDPPNEFAYSYATFTREAAEQWRNNLAVNHPRLFASSYILKPVKG